MVLGRKSQIVHYYPLVSGMVLRVMKIPISSRMKDHVLLPIQTSKLCARLFYQKKSANKTIISILKVTDTNEIIDTTVSLVADECRRLCKRYSGSIQMLQSIASALHARSREMTVLQYLTGFILMNGGCNLAITFCQNTNSKTHNF